MQPKQESGVFDSNVITPGTPFMGRLSDALKYYVHDKLNNDPGWRGIEVIFQRCERTGGGRAQGDALHTATKGAAGGESEHAARRLRFGRGFDHVGARDARAPLLDLARDCVSEERARARSPVRSRQASGPGPQGQAIHRTRSPISSCPSRCCASTSPWTCTRHPRVDTGLICRSLTTRSACSTTLCSCASSWVTISCRTRPRWRSGRARST